MAKKPASKKTTKGKAPSKKAAKAPSRAAAKKPAAKKAATKKPAAKKPTSKKTPAAKKTTKKKVETKKPPKAAAENKTPASKPDKKTDKKTDRKAAAKPAKKGTAKPEAKAAPAKPEAKTTKETAAAEAPKGDDKKSGRKGITIVNDKPQRRTRPAPTKAGKFPPPGPRLLGPGSKIRKPLIPSGPAARDAAGQADDGAASRRKKTPFTKKQLDTYREILLAKRAELIGDVTQMEADALRSNSGGLSNTPQHLAEQGSDSADQSLNLNLAAADRRLIKEIDAALARIADRTYGLCEITNEPIDPDRLEELPWARHSIEAARQLELRGGLR